MRSEAIARLADGHSLLSVKCVKNSSERPEIDPSPRSTINFEAIEIAMTETRTDRDHRWLASRTLLIDQSSLNARKALNGLRGDQTTWIFFTQNRYDWIQISIHMRRRRLRQGNIPFSPPIVRLAMILTEFSTTPINDMSITGRR